MLKRRRKLHRGKGVGYLIPNVSEAWTLFMPGVLLSASLESVHSVFTVTPKGDPITAPTFTHGGKLKCRESSQLAQSHTARKCNDQGLNPGSVWTPEPSTFLKKLIYFNWRLITLQYCGGFCHPLTWISHGVHVSPRPEPRSHLSPHPIPLGRPSTPALSALRHASTLDLSSVWYVGIYMFQCYSLKSSHPRLLP